MPKQPFKKGVANFSKGFVTYLGELDIPEDVFLIFKNVSNFFPGKLKKAPKDVKITTDNLQSEVYVGGKSYVLLYKSSWTIVAQHETPENQSKTYYVCFVQDDQRVGIVVHEASSSDLDSGTTLDNSWLWWAQSIGWNYEDQDGFDIDFFVANGAIRISDANMTTDNVSKWFGHIKRDVFGYNDFSGKTGGGDNYIMAPSAMIPSQNAQINNWKLYDQEIKPPRSVRLSSHLDRDNLCNEVGDVGIFVQDPWILTKKFLGDNESDTNANWNYNFVIDALVWPNTDKRTVFKERDRYATTFIYDYVSESELSRDEFGNIGVSGFPCYEPADIVEASDDDLLFRWKLYMDMDKFQNFVQFEYTGPNDENAQDHVKSLVGRVIRIGSEKMYCIAVGNMAANDSDTAVTVMRGVMNTTPQIHTGYHNNENFGDDVYFNQETQAARAISLVVNTGAEPCKSFDQPLDHSKLNSSGGATYIRWDYNDQLGLTSGGKVVTTIQHGTTSLDGSSTLGDNTYEIAIRRTVAFDYDGDGTNDEGVEIILNCDNGGGRTFTCQNILDIFTLGQTSGKTAVFPGVTNATTLSPVQTAAAGLNKERFLNFYRNVELHGGSADPSATADRNITPPTVRTGSDSSNEWNKRITAIKLYWNPEGETNWYLVNTYDVKKSTIDEATSVMKKSFQTLSDVGNVPQDLSTESASFTHPSEAETGFFVERLNSASGNTGAWIEAPFGSPLFQIGQWATGHSDESDTFNWALSSRWGVCLSPQKVGGSGWDDVATDMGTAPTGTVHNPVACPVGTILLASPTGKHFDIELRTQTDLLHDVYYGQVTHRELTNGNLNNKQSVPWQSKGEDTAFIGGVVFNGMSNEGLSASSTGFLFDEAANTIRCGLDTNLAHWGYKAGDYIMISTSESSSAVNGIYRIESIGDGASTGDMITVDTTFRSVPESGVFEIDGAWISGTKYFANDAGLAMSHSPSHMISIGGNNHASQGNITPIHTDSLLQSPINHGAATYGYVIEGFLARQDVIATRRLPHYGFKGVTYQDKLDRSSKHRFKPVKWACSTLLNGMAIIGNVDIMDENEQSINDRGKILWTLPYKVDEFSLGKSKTIGRLDGDAVVALESFNGALIVVKERNSYACDPSKNFAEGGIFPSIGTKWKNAVVSTPSGVCVANESGVFVLPEMAELSIGIKDTYQKLTFNNPIMGYSPKKQEIVIIPDTSQENANQVSRFTYNFTNKAWIEETCDDPVTAGQQTTWGNFFVGDTGFLEYLYENQIGVSINRIPSTYNDANGNEITDDTVSHLKQEEFHLKSKAHTFDEASQIKYIEYMYITYKFNANIRLKLYTDGGLVGEVLLPPQEALKNRKIPIKREGKTFQYEIIQDVGSSLIDLTIEDIIIEGFYTGKQ